MIRPLRIAMLAHSTNPRGGVVHAMQLSEALQDEGHEVVLHAPDVTGKGFFRDPLCRAEAFPVAQETGGMTALVEQRIADYVAYFEPPSTRNFDVFHAHDGISANALATLRQRGLIDGFVRTVHHIDDFADPRLMELQARSISSADHHFAVSKTWQTKLAQEWGIDAGVSGNGVDTARFTPEPDGREQDLAKRLGLTNEPVFLAIGGVEQRKNTLGILDAFLQARRLVTHAQLVIAGGASLLDHGEYQRMFAERLAQAGREGASVRVVGPIADNEMPALYRLADALVFPSLKEGFGLCVLEAMASGVPAIVSSIKPFTEYLADDDVLWCDPRHPSSIADAMILSANVTLRPRLIRRGHAVAARHDWNRVARAHLPAYARLMEKAIA